MTSTLQKLANKKKKEKTTVLTARIPENLATSFKRHCEVLGLTVSEAINLLVETELKESSNVHTVYDTDTNTNSIQTVDKTDTDTIRIQNVNKNESVYDTFTNTKRKPTREELFAWDDEEMTDEEREEIADTCPSIVDIPEDVMRELEEQRKPKIIEAPPQEIVTNEQIQKELEELRNQPKPKPTPIQNEEYWPDGRPKLSKYR